MSLSGGTPATRAPFDPRRYHEQVAAERTAVAERPPVCLYLEVTNRCNLLCTTCPRTYEELEPPADMDWQLFTSIVDQAPDLARAVLHGVGEPMLVANLPKMVRYLKDRGVYVLFNTNGTVLSERNGRALIEARLDELRVSLDASNRKSFNAIRGRDYFNRIIRNVRASSCRNAKGTPGRRCPSGSRASRKPSRNCRLSCRSQPKPASRRSICNGWCSLMKPPSARLNRTRRCSNG
jgi:hypothetical protein